jgi:hypothetical protein
MILVSAVTASKATDADRIYVQLPNALNGAVNHKWYKDATPVDSGRALNAGSCRLCGSTCCSSTVRTIRQIP